MKRPHSSWLIVVLLGLAAFGPAVSSMSNAFAKAGETEDDGDDEGPSSKPRGRPAPAMSAASANSRETQAKRRAAVLALLKTDETALINVTSGDMPSSPDIVNLGRKGTKALGRCVTDNVDDVLRAECATLLGRIGDASALPALYAALEAWDPSVRRAAIAALRSIASPQNAEPLLRVIAREDEDLDNVDAAYNALGVTSSGKAMRALREALRKPQTTSEHAPSRANIFDALWRIRHLVGKADLVSDVSFALTHQDTALQLRATRAASELRDPSLVPQLVGLMTHKSVSVRNRAVYALGKIGDRAAVSALLAHIPKVRESRMLNNIAFALERTDPNAFFTTAVQLASHKQAAIRMNTAFVLGDVRRNEGVPLLRSALSDPNDTVRLSAISALGSLSNPEVEKLLLPFVEDKRPEFMQAAIHSLHRSSGGRQADLIYSKLYANENTGYKPFATIELIKANDPRMTEEALLALDRQMLSSNVLFPYLSQSQAPNIGGRVALLWAAGRTDVSPLLLAKQPEGVKSLALSALDKAVAHNDVARMRDTSRVAGALGLTEARSALERLARHESSVVRMHGLLALASLGDANALLALWSEIDTAAQRRYGDIEAMLRNVASSETRARLEPELSRRARGDNVHLASVMRSVQLGWDPDKAIFGMLDALKSQRPEERDLAIETLRRDDRPRVTWLLRRALARETHPIVRASLRTLVDLRP